MLVIKPWSNNYEYYCETRVPLRIASAWAVIGSKYLLVLSADGDLRRFVRTYWIINFCSSSPGNTICRGLLLSWQRGLLMGEDAAMREDLIDGHGRPLTSGKHDNNNDCTTTPNNNNQLDEDRGGNAATRDNLINGHSCPCPSGEHNNNEDCATTPNNDNHLDKAALTMTTIDPVICTQQLTNDGSKQMKRRWHSMAVMGSST